TDLVTDARARIPSLSPEWTDHNPTDPGMILVELLAWLSEIVLFRIDQIPERSYRTFVSILRGPEPPPANGQLPALDDAIRDTLPVLRERHRAITPDDFEDVSLHRWPETPAALALGVPGTVRRARCLPEESPTTMIQPGTSAPSHVTLVVVPDSLSAQKSALASFDPSRRYALELDGTSGYVDCGGDASLSMASGGAAASASS